MLDKFHKSEIPKNPAYIENFLGGNKRGENNQEANLFDRHAFLADKIDEILDRLKEEEEKGTTEKYKGQDVTAVREGLRDFPMGNLLSALKKREDEKVQKFEYDLVMLEDWLDKIED